MIAAKRKSLNCTRGQNGTGLHTPGPREACIRCSKGDLSSNRRRSDWRSIRRCFRWNSSCRVCRFAVHCRSSLSLRLRAVSANMSSLSTPVASLACLVQRATVGSRTVSGNVSELAASITLHGLRLTVTSKVVWSSALVACSCAVVASKSTAISTTVAASCGSTSSSACWWCLIRGWAVALHSHQSCPLSEI